MNTDAKRDRDIFIKSFTYAVITSENLIAIGNHGSFSSTIEKVINAALYKSHIGILLHSGALEFAYITCMQRYRNNFIYLSEDSISVDYLWVT